WSVDDGLSSSVFLNNASGIELTVRPTLYNLSGKQLVINPITLGARRQITANIADWLNQNNADDSFKQGNLILNYEAENATLLGSQVVITKAASSLSFDVPVAMPTSFESSRLEGIWWRPNEASRYDLVLSNMQGSSVEVKVAVSGSHGLKDADFDITLAPHQTEVVNLEDNQGGFAAELGKMGTVSITHTGVPGAVVASGMLSEDKKGFSSRFVFEDPAASRSQTLAAAHIMIDRPDVPGFSAETSFTTVALVGNAGEEVMEVTPAVSFVSNDKPGSVRLRTRKLERHEVKAIDVGEELRREGIRGAIKGAGLTLSHTGETGTLVAQLTSHDQTGNHVFDVPLKDPAIRVNQQGGSYLWNIAGDFQNIIHVRNTTDEEAHFTIQLNFESGSYALPLQVVAPQQEVAIDIRRLRDNQTPDSIRRVIPKEVSSGQVTWRKFGPQVLTGRLEVFSKSLARASSFSCVSECFCDPSLENIFFDPFSIIGVPGGIGFVQLLMTTTNRCNANEGPFDISTSATWSSSNTNVITTGLVGSSGCQYTGVGPGNASVIARFQLPTSGIPDLGNGCPPPLQGPTTLSIPARVNPTVTISGLNNIPLGAS
ncbi:MAG: hypothetical protein ACRD4L_13955, partial [Pyrinomonadaceae bacterium]